MCGCMGSGCTSCRPWRSTPPRAPSHEVKDLRQQLRDMEIERNALRLALRLTLERVAQ